MLNTKRIKIKGKEVKMHISLVCACKSHNFAQNQIKFVRSHDREIVTLRNLGVGKGQLVSRSSEDYPQMDLTNEALKTWSERTWWVGA